MNVAAVPRNVMPCYKCLSLFRVSFHVNIFFFFFFAVCFASSYDIMLLENDMQKETVWGPQSVFWKQKRLTYALLGDMPIKFIGKNFVHLSISFKL